MPGVRSERRDRRRGCRTRRTASEGRVVLDQEKVRIRRRLSREGLTGGLVAERLSVSTRTIQDWEKGAPVLQDDADRYARIVDAWDEAS